MHIETTSPVLHTVTESLETDLFPGRKNQYIDSLKWKKHGSCDDTHFREVDVVLYDLFLIQPSSVTVVQTLREIPVVNGLHGNTDCETANEH